MQAPGRPPDTDTRGREVAGVPYVAWDEIQPELMRRWEQGQHMLIIGKTGSGKTTLALELLEDRVDERGAYVMALGTKPRDQTLRRIGWPIVRSWPPTYAQRQTHHVIYWPPYSRPSTAKATSRPAVVKLLDELILEGGWSLFVDEMAYLVETLGLRQVLDEYWNGARASGVSLLAGTQRPAWISRSAVSQGDWAACFRINDLEDRKRAADVLGDRDRYMKVIGGLRGHQFVLVRLTTDAAVITELPKQAARRVGRS